MSLCVTTQLNFTLPLLQQIFWKSDIHFLTQSVWKEESPRLQDFDSVIHPITIPATVHLICYKRAGGVGQCGIPSDTALLQMHFLLILKAFYTAVSLAALDVAARGKSDLMKKLTSFVSIFIPGFCHLEHIQLQANPAMSCDKGVLLFTCLLLYTMPKKTFLDFAYQQLQMLTAAQLKCNCITVHPVVFGRLTFTIATMSGPFSLDFAFPTWDSTDPLPQL